MVPAWFVRFTELQESRHSPHPWVWLMWIGFWVLWGVWWIFLGVLGHHVVWLAVTPSWFF
jgi:hypothetical protein